MMNKALDYNKLLESQSKGKLLKKKLKFPLWASVKYDGNYVAVRVVNGQATFTTSGGLNYTHTDRAGELFLGLQDGVYLAERIGSKGLLGDRVFCNLRGSKTAQTSTNHSYMVHDIISLMSYDVGQSLLTYEMRRATIQDIIPTVNVPPEWYVTSAEELESLLARVTKCGYEGLMLKDPDWVWKKTKSRTVDMCKYKKRRTADLLCVGTTEGEGKYEGLIGSLVLEDSYGRRVSVGSGLDDSDRSGLRDYFIGSVIEIEYEQIIDTYIQPTYIRVRADKTKEEID